MTCNCGEKCFSYQKFNSIGDKRVTTLVSKCARISDPKAFSIIGAKPNLKKKKCSFYSEIELESMVIPEKKIVKKVLPKIRINNHYDELMKNIYLYKNCIENGLNFKNFAARVDYHLDALNYKHFDYSKETTDELEKRITGDPDRIKRFEKKFSKVIISHELLPSIKSKKVSKKKKEQKKEQKKVSKKEIPVENKAFIEYFKNLTEKELENKEDVVKYRIIDEEECEVREAPEESELNDHFEEEEEENEEIEETYEYAEDSVDNDDPGDFSD